MSSVTHASLLMCVSAPYSHTVVADGSIQRRMPITFAGAYIRRIVKAFDRHDHILGLDLSTLHGLGGPMVLAYRVWATYIVLLLTA